MDPMASRSSSGGDQQPDLVVALLESIPALRPLAEAGAKPAHLEHLVRVWLRAGSLREGARRQRLPFPAAVQELLPGLEDELAEVVRPVEASAAEDGSRRELLELGDGRRVECVQLPREALCISSQVGCAVGCGFCATGTLGLTRNLEVVELLAQVVHARRRGAVRKVVFMGMGEPAHNLRAVLAAIRLLGLLGGIGHKELVFSTVGEPAVFEQLAACEVRPSLALSLHSSDAGRRAELLPRAPRIEPRELVEAALAYSEFTGQPLRLQWTLLRGVNDGDDELARLMEWLPGRRVVVDFIEYNPVEAFDHERTPWERTRELTHALHAAGIQAKLRSSAGQDARGGCGQLSAGRS